MTATLYALSPAEVSCDAGGAGAHYGHAERMVAAVLAIDPTVHARVGDLAWAVRLSRDPIDRWGLGDVTIRVPTPWDVRGGVCFARAVEWSVHRSRPFWSPARYFRNVHDAAQRAVQELGEPR